MQNQKTAIVLAVGCVSGRVSGYLAAPETIPSISKQCIRAASLYFGPLELQLRGCLEAFISTPLSIRCKRACRP